MIDFMQDFLVVVAFLAVLFGMVAFSVEIYDRFRAANSKDES